jgi:hypothetical protein
MVLKYKSGPESGPLEVWFNDRFVYQFQAAAIAEWRRLLSA